MIVEYTVSKKTMSIIFNIAISIFSLLLLISSYNLVKYVIENKQINDQLYLIEETITIEDVNNIKYIETIEQPETIPLTNPYWDYMKMDLIDVDFSNLKTTNKDVKGWIQVNGTNVNYPFVQGLDNKYYLTHSFDKTYNKGGWVFLDYRNNLSNSENKNTILYAHGRLDNTMFGSLKKILSDNWLKKKNNHVIKLSTEYENTLWQVFSVYRIPTTSDYIQTDFYDDEEFEIFANMLRNRSIYNFDTTVAKTDRILTLSTCYNNSDKVVLHAKLIKREVK